MKQQHHQKLYKVFQHACDLGRQERAAYLDEACGDDQQLRSDVEELLARDAGDGSFLDSPALASGAGDALVDSIQPLPERIGHYRILRVLGEGGMGVVYLAEQESPRRIVALKVLRWSTTSANMLRRFEHEAELLGRLQHSNIAQVYEAGTAPVATGTQPYFAMEHVEGRPLIDYAEQEGLNVRQRLQLLAEVCDAVHYAHQKRVIHRDLKPANILVTTERQIKILDFGVARLVDPDPQHPTLHTRAGELLGTIPYMSPEQAAGDPEEVDIRCDVYALGVVGYELLTRRLPYDLSGCSMQESLRIIREQSPEPMSNHNPALSGDVGTLIGKALEKDRERRYQSAAALAEDIRRYLRNEPITAHPPSAVYQLRKFARRNTGLVSSVAAIAILLLTGVVAISWLAVELAEQRDEARQLHEVADEARLRAEREARVATAVSTFLEDVFAAGSPHRGRHDMTVAEALEYASAHVDEVLTDVPEIAAAVRLRLAETYFTLGDLDASLAEAEESLAMYQAQPDANPVDLASAMSSVGQLLNARGRADEAEPYLRDALALFDEHTAADDPGRLAVLTNYSALLYQQERFELAEPLMREALERRRRVHGPEHANALIALNNLGNLLRQMGKLDEAEPLIRQNMELHLKVLGEKHLNAITGIYNYADLLRELNRFDEAEPLFLQSLELGREHLPTSHWLIGLYDNGYGELLRQMGRLDEAEPRLINSFHLLEEQLGEAHPKTQRAVNRLVALYQQWNRPDEASAWRERLTANTDRPGS